MLTFWQWINETVRTGCKLGLYPDIYDVLADQPPLAATPRSADFITYLYSVYGDKGPPFSKDGYFWPNNVQIPSKDGFTPRYVNPGKHRHELTEIASNINIKDLQGKPEFPRWRGYKNVVPPATEESGKEIKLSYAVYNVFNRYTEGQNDPLYALLSRRGSSVDFVRIFASPEEIDRLKKVSGEILSNSTDEGEKRTAAALLKLI